METRLTYRVDHLPGLSEDPEGKSLRICRPGHPMWPAHLISGILEDYPEIIMGHYALAKKKKGQWFYILCFELETYLLQFRLQELLRRMYIFLGQDEAVYSVFFFRGGGAVGKIFPDVIAIRKVRKKGRIFYMRKSSLMRQRHPGGEEIHYDRSTLDKNTKKQREKGKEDAA